jgi:diadenosine tetraphosphate (Ap4A) HIT family hydrolase
VAREMEHKHMHMIPTEAFAIDALKSGWRNYNYTLGITYIHTHVLTLV